MCQRKMERKLLGLSLKDRVPNTRIREITKLDDVAQRASRLKWKWGGHVARLQNTSWAYLLSVPGDLVHEGVASYCVGTVLTNRF